MDITIIAAAISTLLGTGGGFLVSWFKMKRENKLTTAQANEIEARIRSSLIDDLQEERKYAHEQIERLTNQVLVLQARMIKLEAIIIRHNLPLPD